VPVRAGTPDDGALFRHALEPLVDEMFDQARREGRHEHRDVYMYDALIELLNRYLDTEDDDRLRRRGLSGRTARKRSRSRSNPRYLALLRIDVTALQRGRAHDGELCEIAGVGSVPVAVARRLLGDAIVKLVVTRGVDVLSVTHLGRQATAAQRVALLWQSPTCANQACPHSFVQIDHRQPWAATHQTRLDALDPLCPHCHRLKTHHNWALIPGTGKRPFVPPTDPRHPDRTHTRPERHAAA
jgi:hypothetical protein